MAIGHILVKHQGHIDEDVDSVEDTVREHSLDKKVNSMAPRFEKNYCNSINMYYLKDLLLKEFIPDTSQNLTTIAHYKTTSIFEKFDSLLKMRQNCNIIVYGQALRAMVSKSYDTFFALDPWM